MLTPKHARFRILLDCSWKCGNSQFQLQIYCHIKECWVTFSFVFILESWNSGRFYPAFLQFIFPFGYSMHLLFFLYFIHFIYLLLFIFYLVIMHLFLKQFYSSSLFYHFPNTSGSVSFSFGWLICSNNFYLVINITIKDSFNNKAIFFCHLSGPLKTMERRTNVLFRNHFPPSLYQLIADGMCTIHFDWIIINMRQYGINHFFIIQYSPINSTYSPKSNWCRCKNYVKLVVPACWPCVGPPSSYLNKLFLS